MIFNSSKKNFYSRFFNKKKIFQSRDVMYYIININRHTHKHTTYIVFISLFLLLFCIRFLFFHSLMKIISMSRSCVQLQFHTGRGIKKKCFHLIMIESNQHKKLKTKKLIKNSSKKKTNKNLALIESGFVVLMDQFLSRFRFMSLHSGGIIH